MLRKTQYYDKTFLLLSQIAVVHDNNDYDDEGDEENLKEKRNTEKDIRGKERRRNGEKTEFKEDLELVNDM